MSSIPDHFDINGPGIRGNLFGLPYTADSASIVIIPVPWEVTVSYGSGTSKAPQAILEASVQIDLSPDDLKKFKPPAAAMLAPSEKIYNTNVDLRPRAQKVIEKIESGQFDKLNDPVLKIINEECEKLNMEIKSQAQHWLSQHKMVGVLGGDHSTPIGLIRALAERYSRFGMLQIDAHCDLRKSYEGFTYSHASAMFNALKIPAISTLIQVGIRDYSHEELEMIQRASGRVKTFFNEEIKEEFFKGATWDQICTRIVSGLPTHVYISFDIDGLDPKLCPHTGTPVPGGLEFEQVTYLMKKIVSSGRKIIGFDLCEVSPGTNEWDANVGSRVLFQLCHWMALSNP